MVKKRKDGRVEIKVSINGKRYSVYGRNRTECKEKETILRKKIDEGTYKSSKTLTVKEYLLRYLESRERKIKSQTMRTYKKLINRLCAVRIDQIGSTFGSIKLDKLETQNVRDAQTALLEQVSTRTANDILSLLKKALTAAVNEKTLTWNPAAGVERERRTEVLARDTIHRSLTRDEITTFLAAAREGIEKENLEKSWYYNLYVFLLHTGLRIGEASALTLSDTVNGVINVHRTVVRTEIGYEIEEGTKTEAGLRKVPLYPEAKQAVDQQKQLNLMLTGVTSISSPIFRLPKGGIIRSDRVNEDIKRICMATGIERFSCHAFRATFTSRCIQGGMRPKELMEILGHTDVNMTLGLYAHSDDEEKRKQLMAVNFY